MHRIQVYPQNIAFEAVNGANLLEVLREQGLSPESPCGGQGTCGKCLVQIDGVWVKACTYTVTSDITVTLKDKADLKILKPQTENASSGEKLAAAFDIGTTCVVCSVLDMESGRVLSCEATANPQSVYGADVVNRIRAALSGNMGVMTQQIRNCMSLLLCAACAGIGCDPTSIQRVAVVGNPAMQQIFSGISPENLVQIPFSPAMIRAETSHCGARLPICSQAELLTVPDISGYVGADTMGCILSTGMFRKEEITLMVDIGTNGEMVLGNRNRLIACATAAGPALEGANIRFGMRACPGAIDHVWLEGEMLRYSTIGGTPAAGICGSGLIDAVAAFLKLGKINYRGRIEPGEERDGDRILPITDEVYLTQEDIRQVQLAKGAIRAGIELMVREMGISLDEIAECNLAGAFGSFINPESACAIGLLSPALVGKIIAVGNAAMDGANLLAANPHMLRLTDILAKNAEYLELAALDDFPKTFAKAMRFEV